MVTEAHLDELQVTARSVMFDSDVPQMSEFHAAASQHILFFLYLPFSLSFDLLEKKKKNSKKVDCCSL